MRRWLGVGAIALLACAYAWPMQGGGGTPNAQYALVKALEDGTPRVEQSLRELGDFPTRDLVRIDGRLYSNKAPGLAFLTVPLYGGLESAGVDVVGDPTRVLWALGLLGTVLPAVVLLFAMRAVGERVEPGYGTVSAVAAGAGTLLLPYATLFFSHLLAAALVFAAFALLWRSRTEDRPLLLFGAGVLAGYAVVAEYPNALAGAVLGLYAVADRPRLRRGATYAAGVVVGVLPGLLYNWWAFGSPFFNAYGTSPEGRPTDLWGSPSVSAMLDFFLASDGFLAFTPVLACGIAGLVAAWRRGLHAEALTAFGVTLSFVVVLSAYYSPFGGFLLGPRYLITTIPLLALGLPIAFRRAPLATGALAAVSTVVMATVTATHALAGHDGRYFHRLFDRELTLSAASVVGITGWYAMLPFFVAIGGAAVAAALATRWPRITVRGAAAAGVVVVAWLLLRELAPVETAGSAGDYLLLAAIVAVAGVVALRLEQPVRSA